MASITQRLLVQVSTVSARNAWHNDHPFVYKIRRKSPGRYFQENWVGLCNLLQQCVEVKKIIFSLHYTLCTAKSYNANLCRRAAYCKWLKKNLKKKLRLDWEYRTPTFAMTGRSFKYESFHMFPLI